MQILRRQSTRVSCGSVLAHCYNLHSVVRIFGKEVDKTLQERRLFDDSFAVNEVSLSRGVFQGLEIMRFITEDAALAVS